MSTGAQSLLDAGTARARVPDFFIVGHHKSGTTALYEMLSRHPQIFMPDLKEPRFLASDMRSRFTNPRGRRLPQTLEDYLSLFADASPQQRAGEASPSYLWSRTAAQRISEIQPAARIIAILREPAAFLRSLHLQFLRSHVESEKDLRRALALEGDRREGRHVPRRSHLPQLLQYSEHVRYVEQLRRYHTHFPAEQVMVLIYDDFRADNPGTLRSVTRFLEVDQEYPLEEVYANETTHTMRSQQIDDLLLSITLGRSPLSRACRAAMRRLAPQQLRREALRTIRRRAVVVPASAPDEELMSELRERFKGEVESLSDYLERDLLTQWGYRELG